MKHYKTQQAFVCSVPVFPISGELLARDMNNCQNKSDYEVFQSRDRENPKPHRKKRSKTCMDGWKNK